MTGDELPLASPRSPTAPVPGSPTPPSPRSPGSYFGNRTSIFLPHPNAPRPRPRPNTGEEAGPMYGRKSVAFPDSTPVPPLGPLPGSAVHTMHLARGIAFAPPTPGAPIRRAPPTIYALTAIDLSESTGPVPVTFSLEPPNAVPAQRLAAQRAMTVDGSMPVSQGTGLVPGTSPNTSASSISPAPALSPPPEVNVIDATPPQSKVLSRPGFQPKAPSMRPRSRSFSAVERPVASTPPAMPNRYSLLAVVHNIRAHVLPVDLWMIAPPRPGLRPLPSTTPS
jgi:TBC1 domain family member 10